MRAARQIVREVAFWTALQRVEEYRVEFEGDVDGRLVLRRENQPRIVGEEDLAGLGAGVEEEGRCGYRYTRQICEFQRCRRQI